MKISTKGRYAVAIMVELAKVYDKDEFISIHDISQKSDISVKYLEKIMISLKKHDFFISSRGGIFSSSFTHCIDITLSFYYN